MEEDSVKIQWEVSSVFVQQEHSMTQELRFAKTLMSARILHRKLVRMDNALIQLEVSNVGVMMGMFWTSVGGFALIIERDLAGQRLWLENAKAI